MISKNKVLIVDDDPNSARLQERVLGSRYDVQIVASGEEALAVLPRFNPDLILLDISMPGQSGYETCRRIRCDENYRLVKILLVSGHASLEERLKGYEVGADDYVAKPFDNNELRAKIEVFMKLKRTEEIDDIKSDLLTLFSHETRTPLGGIIGISELMATDESLPEDVRAKASLIHSSGVDLHKFIEKATLLCKLKSGMSLHLSEDSLHRHLLNARRDREDLAEKRGIEMLVECPEEIALSADWQILDEVFGYLMDNAVKYTSDNSHIKATAAVDDDVCTISFSDQGAGIEQSTLDAIFDEFAVQDLMHHQRGQGLSLAIAKQVIELHSGQIAVDSEPGEGATFTLRLPADVPPPPEHSDRSA
jgi:two-component system, sensor histidine kinase and response regulator